MVMHQAVWLCHIILRGLGIGRMSSTHFFVLSAYMLRLSDVASQFGAGLVYIVTDFFLFTYTL